VPRIYTSASDPIDFCKRDFPQSEAAARRRFGNVGDGPDGRGNCFSYDDEHPDYTDDPKMYRCYTCKKPLTENDQ
jgi:hypothetical protein